MELVSAIERAIGRIHQRYHADDALVLKDLAHRGVGLLDRPDVPVSRSAHTFLYKRRTHRHLIISSSHLYTDDALGTISSSHHLII
jgi:hypothetical protein